MKLPKKYDETVGSTGEYEVLTPGGYICKVVNAKEEESKNGNRMLVIAFDIAEGEHKGIYQRRYDELSKNDTPENRAKWPNNGVHRITVEDKDGNCNKFFKGFITSIENSNANFNFKELKADEKTLKDKLFGGIFGEEEYEGMDGKIKTATKLRFIRTTANIEDGNYTVPECKKINKIVQDNIFDTMAVTSDDDLPF